MKKDIKNLDNGSVITYDLGDIKVHNYNTNDLIANQVIVLEKNQKLAIIESPAFYDNDEELERYIASLDVKVDGILLSYHMAGGTFLANSHKYTTKEADTYGHNGGGKALVDNFEKNFGYVFDSNIHEMTNSSLIIKIKRYYS